MSDSTLVQALKQLRKGDGLTLGSIAMLDDVEAVFGTSDFVAIREAILNAIELERSDKCVAALANAYAIGCSPGTKLTERRERYVAENKLAMRTLTNYEDFGTVVLAQLLQLPISASLTEVDVLLSVVEDMVHHALSRDTEQEGLFDADQQKAILGKLRKLHDAEDSSITEAHHVRLKALLDQFTTKHFEMLGERRTTSHLEELAREPHRAANDTGA